jgi:hypothetical protein
VSVEQPAQLAAVVLQIFVQGVDDKPNKLIESYKFEVTYVDEHKCGYLRRPLLGAEGGADERRNDEADFPGRPEQPRGRRSRATATPHFRRSE